MFVRGLQLRRLGPGLEGSRFRRLSPDRIRRCVERRVREGGGRAETEDCESDGDKMRFMVGSFRWLRYAPARPAGDSRRGGGPRASPAGCKSQPQVARVRRRSDVAHAVFRGGRRAGASSDTRDRIAASRLRRCHRSGRGRACTRRGSTVLRARPTLRPTCPARGWAARSHPPPGQGTEKTPASPRPPRSACYSRNEAPGARDRCDNHNDQHSWVRAPRGSRDQESAMNLLDPRFKYVPAASTDVASTWRRFGYKPVTDEERRTRLLRGQPEEAVRSSERGTGRRLSRVGGPSCGACPAISGRRDDPERTWLGSLQGEVLCRIVRCAIFVKNCSM